MKNLMNLGKTLNKNEQKQINGGTMMLACERQLCMSDTDCASSGSCSCCVFDELDNGYCNS